MPPRPCQRVVIVGAGLAGAATAWHLRRLGVRDVRLLERQDAPGQRSSGRSAGILREAMEDGPVQAMAARSARALRSWGVVRETGGLQVGLGQEDLSRRMPLARGTGTFVPRDGVVDVAALLSHYLAGQSVSCGTDVLGWDWDPGRRRFLLHTSAGEMEAAVLVNAAGARAGMLGGLPLTPTRRHLFRSVPLPGVGPDLPYVWDGTEGYYFRPDGECLLLCACDEVPCAPDEDRIDPAVEALLRHKLSRHQPALAQVRLVERWVGQRTFAPDRLPVLGEDPRQPALVHAAGLGGHGVTLSYEVGRRAAAACAGRLKLDPTFAPSRLLLPALK